ncbi:MAG: N(4)-(beta-N-acetylglucosaminyl)-L-asparaginase [Xanthomonadales bacterium]|nr:N(4)-(beta-N-acetylglucosaminyl)-L-asparaginase [Xanthomonadales bacterium]ODU92039.1 MAG: N(4)-(beta-N-acetylglucosaminyl)-L-asparaginase [Rhodanobacter sp. SCN 66-43]OJY85051.1 MAG: N(4)-(beta-N-acetylglucosaminyl)-L-asparaginase [Xanthomonadales bacterium 66-474]
MTDRRQFLRTAALGAAAATLSPLAEAADSADKIATRAGAARVASTWDFGVAANHAAWAILSKGGHSLDAVEAGARVPEADIRNHSVGLGGYPDRYGHVTLDASIMDAEGNCGGVACLEDIGHAVSVARAVMEKTPHLLLVGDGALQFALAQGFKRQNLLTPAADKAWREWLKTSHYQPRIDSEVCDYGAGVPVDKHNHDTIGILALDAHGKLAGACTTSGLAWKLHGRVGDSPIIGAGLYVDGEVGAATSTGMGEEVIRNAGAFLVVELMRQGRTPAEACKEAVLRVLHKHPSTARGTQVAFLATNKDGDVGGYAIRHGFSYAVCDARDQSRLVPSASVLGT